MDSNVQKSHRNSIYRPIYKIVIYMRGGRKVPRAKVYKIRKI